MFLALFAPALAADLPLESITYRVDVTGPVASVVVEQTFQDPEAAVARMLDAMDAPVLSDVTIDWGAWQVSSAYPSRLAALHVGSAAMIAAHVPSGSGPVRVSGRFGSGTFSQIVTPVHVEEDRPMVTTWARKRVAEIHQRKLKREITDERPEILAIGLRWHILTDYTSFVAVERRPEQVVVQGFALPAPDEFLARIPTGRSYQSAVSSSSSGFIRSASRNFTYDAPYDAPSLGDLPTLGRPLLPDMDVGTAGTNVLTGEAAAWSRFGEGSRGGGASGGLGGPVHKDRFWVGAAARVEGAEQAGLSALSTSVVARLTAQPSSGHRFTLDLDGDPLATALAGTTSRYGGGRGTLLWNHFPNAGTRVNNWVTGVQRTVRGDTREGLEVGTALQLWDVPLAGDHDLGVGFTGDHFVWRGSERAGTTTLGSVFLEDRWKPGNVTVNGRLAAGVLAGDYVVLPSPTLGASWDLFYDQRTLLHIKGSRNWDAEALQVGVADAQGLPSRADTATFGVDQAILHDLSVWAAATARLEHLAFVPTPDHVTVDDAGEAIWVDRTVWEIDVNLSKRWAKRWKASVNWRERFPPSPDATLLADPGSFWVPGFLDAYRRHALDAYLQWDLPVDPFTTTIAMAGAWSSAVDGPGTGWWLDPRSSVSGILVQSVPAPRGAVYLELRATWSIRDPGGAFLPLAVLATDPDAPTLQDQPPFSGLVRIRSAF